MLLLEKEAMSSKEDSPLLRELVFYGSYHNNKWNQLIHFFCVPMILWGLCVWLAQAGPVLPFDITEPLLAANLLPSWAAGAAVLNLSFCYNFLYLLYYVTLDPFAGITWFAFVGVPIWLSSTAFMQLVDSAWKWALGAFLLGWYMQIHPGHMVLEKRRPALVDSMIQAFMTAPLFVWFELLFLFGYRRQLYRNVQKQVKSNIAVFRRKHRAF